MPPKRNPLLVAAIVLLCVSGLGGAAWFLTTQPIYSSTEQNILCHRCALQRASGSRRILGFPSRRTTNEFVTDICAILRGTPPRECEHFWRQINEVESTVLLRPLPQGIVRTHLYIDMSGLADQKVFLESMRRLADADLNGARNLWSNLVWRVSKSDPAMASLKSMVQQNQPVDAVRAFLTNLPNRFPVTF